MTAVAADDTVAVIGLGYVGLPLALRLHAAGLRVVGVDVDPQRVRQLRAGTSPIDDVSDSTIATVLEEGLTFEHPENSVLQRVDVVFICVPTPINESREPDLTAVLSATNFVARSLKRGQLVILQSTTFPGTTTGPVRKELERSGLDAGSDFGLAYAPERLSPGDVSTLSAPKLVGGLTPSDTARAAALLSRLGGEVVQMSSPDAAEMAKLLENVFRTVNIAFVNQLALLCERMRLDVWEVVDAAATKPFGFMPFRPGPGVGGHCIPVDPHYLAWRARQFGVTDRFVELAGDINGRMPAHVVALVIEALNEYGSALKGARVGVLGVAFKPNVRDSRNSPAAKVMAGLARLGAEVEYHDPHVDDFADASGRTYRSQDVTSVIRSDVVVALVNHAAIDWGDVYADARLIVDAVNSSAGHTRRPKQVLRLGAGWG